jgi:hypothetical protein
LRFCLRFPARVVLNVYNEKGETLWTSQAAVYPVGQHQVWFSGQVKGGALTPGRYLFQVTADYGQARLESRQGSITRERRRKR